MWTATIAETKLTGGVLRVNISYTNGDDSFNEIHDLRTGRELDGIVSSRLGQLAELEAFILPLGIYTPPAEPEVVIDPKALAITKLRETQDLVKLGVLTEDDPTVTAAIDAVKVNLNEQTNEQPVSII